MANSAASCSSRVRIQSRRWEKLRPVSGSRPQRSAANAAHPTVVYRFAITAQQLATSVGDHGAIPPCAGSARGRRWTSGGHRRTLRESDCPPFARQKYPHLTRSTLPCNTLRSRASVTCIWYRKCYYGIAQHVRRRTVAEVVDATGGKQGVCSSLSNARSAVSCRCLGYPASDRH